LAVGEINSKNAAFVRVWGESLKNTADNQPAEPHLQLVQQSAIRNHQFLLILHPSSFILHPSSFILHPSSFILHPSSFILHPSKSVF
jgi:hypothetical protein